MISYLRNEFHFSDVYRSVSLIGSGAKDFASDAMKFKLR